MMLAYDHTFTRPLGIEVVDDRLSDQARNYLDGIRQRGWLDDIRMAFERADKLSILFVGETIIDEYRYVAPLAKPSKEFILATVECRSPERFLGGVQAASLHADWPRARVVSDDGEPLRKTRFVEDGTARKIFEVYSKPRIDWNVPQRDAFDAKLRVNIGADVVIVMDFGHGLLDSTYRRVLTDNAKFLAVNAQTNAGNYGFNPVTKYSRADLVCVDLPEAQLATGEQFGYPEYVAYRISRLVDSDGVIITHGRTGATPHYGKRINPTGACPTIPAFTTRALDTMGAGDAFLAVTAPLVAAGLDLEAAAFVGNVAGAIKTDIVGHRRHVGRAELMDRIGELLS